MRRAKAPAAKVGKGGGGSLGSLGVAAGGGAGCLESWNPAIRWACTFRLNSLVNPAYDTYSRKLRNLRTFLE